MVEFSITNIPKIGRLPKSHVFGGQKYMKETVEKVKELRKKIDDKKLKVQIEIDGGINFENAKLAKKAGVDILVSGTTIFKENRGNLNKNIQLLRTG